MRSAATAVAFLALATACRTLAPAHPLPPDDPRPASLLARWFEEAEQRRALRGVARLAIDADAVVPLRGRIVMVLERPARLRLEILGLFGQALAVLVTDGDRFQFFRADDRSIDSGRVHPGLLWNLAYLPLTPEEAVGLLLGLPTPDPALGPVGARLAPDGEVQIDLADATGTVVQRVAFDAEARLRWIEVRDTRGRPLWRAHFDEYERVDELPFAHRISFHSVDGDSRAVISFRDVELNPELPAGIFALRPGGG